MDQTSHKPIFTVHSYNWAHRHGILVVILTAPFWTAEFLFVLFAHLGAIK